MITKHDLEYVGHESMADYYESIALQIEHNNLSTANDMKSKLSRHQLRDFEDFILEAYYYESYDNTFH
jgi:argonaute-like protein implicated in RNA metabolism and viral defense